MVPVKKFIYPVVFMILVRVVLVRKDLPITVRRQLNCLAISPEINQLELENTSSNVKQQQC